MSHPTPQALSQPEPKAADPPHEPLLEGTHDLIANAVEAGLATFVGWHADEHIEDVCEAIVRNGYLPKCSVQTGIGNVPFKCPRCVTGAASTVRASAATRCRRT